MIFISTLISCVSYVSVTEQFETHILVNNLTVLDSTNAIIKRKIHTNNTVKRVCISMLVMHNCVNTAH